MATDDTRTQMPSRAAIELAIASAEWPVQARDDKWVEIPAETLAVLSRAAQAYLDAEQRQRPAGCGTGVHLVPTDGGACACGHLTFVPAPSLPREDGPR